MCLFALPPRKSCLLYINAFFGSTLGLHLSLGALPPPLAATSLVTTLDPMLAAPSSSSWTNWIPPLPPSTYPPLPPSAPVLGPMATTVDFSCVAIFRIPVSVHRKFHFSVFQKETWRVSREETSMELHI